MTTPTACDSLKSRENAEMKRVHVLESYREFPDGLIGPDAERDRRWGMEDGFGAAWMNTKW